MLLGLLKVVQQRVVEVDVPFLLEVAGQLAQDQFVKSGAVSDALDLGLHQPVEIGDRGVQVDGRIEQQHFLEVEAAAGFIQVRDECRIQGAEAVTGQVVIGHRQARVLRPDSLHHPIHVFGIFLGDTWRGEARCRADEVEAGRRRQLHHVITGLVIQLLQVLVEAAVIACTRAGNQEDQRGGFILGRNAIGEFLD